MQSAHSVFGGCDEFFLMRCTRFIRGMHHLHKEFLRCPEYRVRLRGRYDPRVMSIFVRGSIRTTGVLFLISETLS